MGLPFAFLGVGWNKVWEKSASASCFFHLRGVDAGVPTARKEEEGSAKPTCFSLWTHPVTVGWLPPRVGDRHPEDAFAEKSTILRGLARQKPTPHA